MELSKPFRELTDTVRCLGEYALWALQDAFIAVDDAIVELPDA